MRLRSINIVAPDVHVEAIGTRYRCESFSELRTILETLPAAGPAVLDLSGHSTRAHKYVRFGNDAIDLLDPKVERWFRALDTDGVLARLEICAVRLLGCETAVGAAGQRTLIRMSRLLGLPVYGTLKSIFNQHYDEHGFRPAFEHLLVEASNLRPAGGTI
jgi:hypothetical protein